MKKEIIECDLCGGEIKEKHGMYYHLEKEFLECLEEPYNAGPSQMDICRYCMKELLEPLGKWPEKKPSDPVLAPEDDMLEILDDPTHF